MSGNYKVSYREDLVLKNVLKGAASRLASNEDLLDLLGDALYYRGSREELEDTIESGEGKLLFDDPYIWYTSVKLLAGVIEVDKFELFEKFLDKSLESRFLLVRKAVASAGRPRHLIKLLSNQLVIDNSKDLSDILSSNLVLTNLPTEEISDLISIPSKHIIIGYSPLRKLFWKYLVRNHTSMQDEVAFLEFLEKLYHYQYLAISDYVNSSNFNRQEFNSDYLDIFNIVLMLESSYERSIASKGNSSLLAKLLELSHSYLDKISKDIIPIKEEEGRVSYRDN